MTRIDYEQPIETTEGEPCTVVELDPRDKNFPAQVKLPSGSKFWFRSDGTGRFKDTPRIRNTVAKPAAPAITLPAGWVAHTPYLAERTADRVVVVMDQHNEAAPYFSRSTMPGAGRFGAFYHLRNAVEFYDKQWPARPAGWTWQAADENHGSHWRRDADGYRVTETLDQWRGVTPDGYMTTSYYKTAEAVMAFAEQTRPVK